MGKARRDGPLTPAAVGSKIDVTHPAAVAWLEERGVDVDAIDPIAASAPQRRAPRDDGDEPPAPDDSVPFDLEDLPDDLSLDDVRRMTLRQLTDRFGTAERFLTWTKARKELAAARRAELLLARTGGVLVERVLVGRLFGYLDALTERLLRDVATRAARRVPTFGDPESAEHWLRGALTLEIRRAREHIQVSLKADDPAMPLHLPGHVSAPKAPSVNHVRRARELERNRTTQIAKGAVQHSVPKVLRVVRRRLESAHPPDDEELDRIVVRAVTTRIASDVADLNNLDDDEGAAA